MAEYTPNLNLLKKDPVVDGNDTFNIKTMLNDNWDKIDASKKVQDNAINNIKDDIQNINIPVKSVNQKTGNVVLNATDVGAETPQASQEKANKALDAAKSYTDEVANGLGDKISILNGSGEIKEKANKIDLDTLRSRSISTGTGLSGGGDLSQDRVLNVLFGTTSTTVARGNHKHSATDISDVSPTVTGGGNANGQFVNVGFTPKVVIAGVTSSDLFLGITTSRYNGYILTGTGSFTNNNYKIASNGFYIFEKSNEPFVYVAIG